MKQHKVLSTFTPEQMELLSANKFTAHVDRHRILFTLEFKNLFMSQYEQGFSSMEIFINCGYDPDILGDNRIYGFAKRLRNQYESGHPFTESYPCTIVSKPENTDYNTLPSQLSVSAMQRELTYLRQQVEFLKKITELDKDKK